LHPPAKLTPMRAARDRRNKNDFPHLRPSSSVCGKRFSSRPDPANLSEFFGQDLSKNKLLQKNCHENIFYFKIVRLIYY